MGNVAGDEPVRRRASGAVGARARARGPHVRRDVAQAVVRSMSHAVDLVIVKI